MAFSDEQITNLRRTLGVAEDADEATILAALTEALDEPPSATPLVHKLAREAGVHLSSVRGTGVGGRITAADVRAAAGPRLAQATAARAAAPRPRAIAAGRPQPRLMVTAQSYWSRIRAEATVDVYGFNPLLEDLRQTAPQQYAQARAAGGEAPTLFTTGDLPMFTASGMEPGLLLQLPWVARHAAASATLAEANELFETYGEPTKTTWDAALMQFGSDTGVLVYESRVAAWASPNGLATLAGW